MKFGVCLPTFRYGAEPTVEHITQVALAAEQLGFDSVWVGDHVLVPADQKRMRFFSDPLITLGVIAGMTQKVALGTSVIIAPMRNPLVLAKQVATLDYLSRGRVILGLGAGWLEREFDYLNADFHTRGKMLDETICVLRAVYGSVPASFKGEFFEFSDAVLEPQPARPGGPPIWIGGGSAHALKRAATLGDGWHADDTPAPQVQAARATIQKFANGRNVEISTRVTTKIHGIGETSVSAPSRAEGYYRSGDSWKGIVGYPDELLSQVQEFAAAGSTHFICQFEHASVSEHLASLQAFAEEVIAKFKEE